MNRVAAAPCQCSSPGSKKTRSPVRMTSIGPPRRWARPMPSVTQIVWPFGCVCQAVRAPGVQWTLLALSREAADGAATVSTYTEPVNQSSGPAVVSRLFLVICMGLLLVRCRSPAGEQAQRFRGLRARLGGVDEHGQAWVCDELHCLEREGQVADDGMVEALEPG